MKRTFGTFLSRLRHGGVRLTELEYFLLCQLVQALPREIQETVQLQFDAYDLAQREVDGRALNFYCKRKSTFVPRLLLRAEECPLIRLSAQVPGEPKTIHAVLTAVEGRAFRISLSERVDQVRAFAGAKVIEVVQSWRSNIVERELPPNHSFDPMPF